MSACSGIYRSENQGGEWVKLQGIPYAARRTQVIVQDAASPQTLYAGTTAGLWVTRDGGENWARTTSSDWVVNSIAIVPGKNGGPGRVVLGTEGRGVEVSDDAGVTFAEANHGFTHLVVKELVADSTLAGHLLMVVERSTTEILESRDDGKSWSALPLAVVEKARSTSLNVAQLRQAFVGPWGWMVRLENGQIWNWDEHKRLWKEWILSASVNPTSTTHRCGQRCKTGSGAHFAGGWRNRVLPRGCRGIDSRRSDEMPGVRELREAQGVWPWKEHPRDLGIRERLRTSAR